jgi:aspartate kinase
MIVAKFGGTSVQDAACIQRAVGIVGDRLEQRPLVVVSALAGVTRQLLALGRQALAEAAAARRELGAIGNRHLAILGELDTTPGERRWAEARSKALLAALQEQLDEIAGSGVYDGAAQDGVIAFGERLSTTLFGAAARGAGLAADNVDAAEVVVTDDRFRSARPDRGEIGRRAALRLRPLLEAGRVPVVEGFIGATTAGQTTTMGFEASDLTASLLGAALGAAEVQIWTDVPGMLTTGHPAIAAPRRVPRLSFGEARELALFGAKVLHPDTVEPAREHGIPVRILNSRDPAGEGTWITASASGMAAVAASASRAAAVAAGTAVAVASVKSIAVTEDLAAETAAAVRAALGDGRVGAAARGRAVVCLVGEGIGAVPGGGEEIVGRIRRALAGMAAEPAAAGTSNDRLPLVMRRELVAEAVARLHREFFAGAD